MVYLLGHSALGRNIQIEVAGAHVWVGWQQEDVQHTGVIDVTADQLSGANLPACTIAPSEEILGQGVLYQPGRMFADVRSLKAQFAIREQGVSQRIDLLRHRYEEYFQHELHTE